MSVKMVNQRINKYSLVRLITHSSRGSALLAVLAVAGILGILGFAFLSKVSSEQRHAGRWRRATQAFYLAEAAISKGVNLLQEEAITEFPYTETDVSFGSGEYSLTIEREQSGQEDGTSGDHDDHDSDHGDDDHDSDHGDDDHDSDHGDDDHGCDHGDDDHDSDHGDDDHGCDHGDDDHDSDHGDDDHGCDHGDDDHGCDHGDDDHDSDHGDDDHDSDHGDDDHDSDHGDDDHDSDHGDDDSDSDSSGAYAVDLYTITGEGEVGGVKRSVQVRLREDTFLRFARFVQSSNLSYARNAVLSGDVWTGVDLRLTGYPVTFMRDVSARGRIQNRSNGIFHGSVTENATPIDLQTAVNLNYYKNLAQGNVADQGVGIYSSTHSTINLDSFDFSGSTPKYNGSSLGSDFNGVVYVSGDAYVEGTLHGGSITIIASDDVVITGHIRTGCTGNSYTQTNPPTVFNSAQGQTQTATVDIDDLITTNTPVVRIRTSGRKWNKIKGELLANGQVISTTYLIRESGSPDEQMATFSNFTVNPSGYSYSVKLYYQSSGTGSNPTWIRVYDGNPVNLGLVAKDTIYIDSQTPRQLVVDAALLARDGNWRALGSSSSHPSGFDGSWVLTINGPIITRVGGSAGPWSSYGVRRYNHDEDIVDYSPPYFPVPLGGWQRIYWKEILPKDIS